MPFRIMRCGRFHDDIATRLDHDDSFPTRRSDPTHPSSYDLQQAAQDDISNHNLQSPAVRSEARDDRHDETDRRERGTSPADTPSPP